MKIEPIEHYDFLITLSEATKKSKEDIQKEILMFQKEIILNNTPMKELIRMYKKASELTLMSNKKIEEKVRENINIWDDKETSDLLVEACIANLTPSLFTDKIDSHIKLKLGKEYLPSSVKVFNSDSIFSIDFNKKNSKWNEENPEGLIEEKPSIRIFISLNENIIYLYLEKL